MAPRTYTVDEANQVLADVKPLVERIVDLLPRMPDMEEEVRIREMRSRRPGAGEDATEMLARSVAELRSTEMSVAVAVERLQEMDVQLKDARVGLVDFLAYRDGELVELCWRLGEASVASWHRIGEGFAGRKPL